MKWEVIVKGKLPEAVLIFIQPPSMEELEYRLRNRGTEDDEVINRRLREAAYEMAQKDAFEHIVTNDILKDAQLNIDKILYPQN